MISLEQDIAQSMKRALIFGAFLDSLGAKAMEARSAETRSKARPTGRQRGAKHSPKNSQLTKGNDLG